MEQLISEGYDNYTLLSDTDINNLQKTIEAKRAEGWEPYGSPFTRNFNIVQPMARKANFNVTEN